MQPDEPAVAAANGWPGSPAAYALRLDAFLAEEVEGPPALLGSAEDALIPAAGLVIIAGRPGTGKTTLAIDGAFHLASGQAWLGQPVERPARVLIVENEGPREPFRRKLRAKQSSWRHEIRGELFVHTFRWGAASFVDEGHARALKAFLEEERIDLVIGDPLTGLGVGGVDSPEDVRKFVTALCKIGLFRDRAFWFLHHFRHGATRNGNGTATNEIDEFSGAWGGYPDTLLVLKELEGDRVRLSFPKVRWAASEFRPLVLARRRADASFDVVTEERPGGDRDLEAEILTLLAAAGGWHTLTDINRPKKDGGVGADRDAVRVVLDELTRAGEVAYQKSPPERPRAGACWRLAQGLVQARATSLFGEGAALACTAPNTPVGGGAGASNLPQVQADVAQAPVQAQEGAVESHG